MYQCLPLVGGLNTFLLFREKDHCEHGVCQGWSEAGFAEKYIWNFFLFLVLFY